MFKKGMVKKIEMKDFVTHSHIELFPEPNFNMIVGANGTGKSTIVAALILGLDGDPSVVGRGMRLNEYIKHGRETAKIHITLQGDDADGTFTVTREFDYSGKTTWYLNSKKVKREAITTLVKKLNIQVNNLCQFLPQERVQDFAKLNKQDLLKEVQRALCRFDLMEKQERLIESRALQKGLVQDLDKSRKGLEAAQTLNARLEASVGNLKEKQKLQSQVEHIDRKVAWVRYESSRLLVTEVKGDLQKARGICDRLRGAVEPVRKEIESLNKDVGSKQDEVRRLVQAAKDEQHLLNRGVEKTERMRASIQAMDDEMEGKIMELTQDDVEREEMEAQAANLKRLCEQLRDQYESRNSERQKIQATLEKSADMRKQALHQKGILSQEKQESNNRLQMIEDRLSRLENVNQKKMEMLQRHSSDTHQAVMWVRNNKQLFKGQVFEPLILELNVLDVQHGKYLENVIPMRDRLAFFCELKEDMETLIKQVRINMKLNINAITARETRQFQPQIPLEHMRKFGFFEYVSNIFTAPPNIKHYLCKTYGLHNIPIGTEQVDQLYMNIPSQVSCFFSGMYKYRIAVSEHSGEKRTTQTRYESDQSLSQCANNFQIDELKRESKQLMEKITAVCIQYKKIEKEMVDFEMRTAGLRSQLAEIAQVNQQRQLMEKKFSDFQRLIEAKIQSKANPDEIRAATRNKIKTIVKDLLTNEGVIQGHVKKISRLAEKQVLLSSKIKAHRNAIATLEEETRENTARLAEAEETLNAVTERHQRLIARAKSLLLKAKDLSNGFTPNDDGFAEFLQEYHSLDSNEEKLNQRREQILSRIACLCTASPEELEEYETRLREIQTTTRQLEACTNDLDRLTVETDRMQNSWLTPLQAILEEINSKFSSFFERIGCAGEVSLYRGDNDKEFDQYGVCIKVTYRNGELLQELNSNIQSGGERAVATAIFMMSLQEMTPVPFRCVDEINQGMDADNERLIFDLIVETTCHDDSSQYFFITPKLISNLSYNQKMSVHVIENGPFVAPDKKWSRSTLSNLNI